MICYHLFNMIYQTLRKSELNRTNIKQLRSQVLTIFYFLCMVILVVLKINQSNP